MNMMTKDRPAALLPRAELFALFARDEIERAVDALIAHLDAIDGDPDLEDTFDREADRSDAEGFTWPEVGENLQPQGYGCGVAVLDDDAEADGWRLRKDQRDRIRRTACDVRIVGNPRYAQWPVFTLRERARNGAGRE